MPSNIWFISDTHFNHKRILEMSNRPFDSVDQMNEVIISNWNKLIKPRDTVYHLGDFCFNNKPNIFTDRLNGRINLILGNHDKYSKKNLECFEHVTIYRKIRISGKSFILFHYPIWDWDKRFNGSIHLHGHVHENTDVGKNMVKDYESKNDFAFNMNVEYIDYTPVNVDTILGML